MFFNNNYKILLLFILLPCIKYIYDLYNKLYEYNSSIIEFIKFHFSDEKPKMFKKYNMKNY